MLGDFISVAPWAFPWGLQVILMPQGAWAAHAAPASNSAATFYHFIDAASGGNGFTKVVLLFCAGMQWAGRICLILKEMLSLSGWDRLGLPIFAIINPSRRFECGSPPCVPSLFSPPCRVAVSCLCPCFKFPICEWGLLSGRTLGLTGENAI